MEFVELSGRLTKNGVGWDPLPELQFVLRDGVEDDFRFGRSSRSTGDGVFVASLPPGTYDPRLFMGTGHLVTHIVPAGVEVSGPTHLDIDFRTVVVSGEVRLAGDTFPADEANRGRVCLREIAGDSDTFCGELSDGSAATFSIEVPRGRVYEVGWSRAAMVPSGSPLNDLPYGQQTFASRSFEADTVLDLDVDAPSLVLSGRIASEGTLVSELTPRPDGFVEIGPVTVDLVEQGEATFQIRLIAGTYNSVAYLFSTTGAIRTLLPCPSSGCVFSRDTDWLLDVVTPSTAVVQGAVDFVDLAGEAVLESALGTSGQVRLEAVADAATGLPPRGTGMFIASVDATRQFRLEAVPFGTYSVSFWGGDSLPGPLGIFRFDELLVVDREQVTWRRAATVLPAIIDLTVNGGPMPDDSLLEGEPRGQLLFSEEGRDPRNVDGVRLSLGETGPARFERLMLKGRYQLSVAAQTSFGRTHVRGLEEDVLPIGRLALGNVELGAASKADEPALLSFDLQVRDVRLRVQHTELVSATSKSSLMISLTSESGGYPFWVHPTSAGAETSLRVYAGCYKVAALASELPHYPDTDAHEDEVPVGTLCTCEPTKR